MAPRLSYPVALLLDGCSCLVVGGGRVALRKATSLVEAGAIVTVVAPTIAPELEALSVKLEHRRYRAGEAAGYHLCCTATGDRAVDGAVAQDARAAGVLVNAADDPENCTFILPAVLREGPITISISTDAVSPALAVWLRDRIAASLDTELATLARLAATARSEVRGAGVRSEGLDWGGLFDSLDAALRPGSTSDPDAVVRQFVDNVIRLGDRGARGGETVPSG